MYDQFEFERPSVFDIIRFEMALTLRQLCKETSRLPCKALFFFWDEKMTEIAPTRLIIEKSIDLKEGMTVTVNWQGRKVPPEILALSGK